MLPKNILHLTLKKEWFYMILSGYKKEEYREIKPYWNVRIKGNEQAIKFTNGYSPDSPSFLIECTGVRRGLGIIEWGAPYGKTVYILKLGKIIAKSVSLEERGLGLRTTQGLVAPVASATSGPNCENK